MYFPNTTQLLLTWITFVSSLVNSVAECDLKNLSLLNDVFQKASIIPPTPSFFWTLKYVWT